MDCFHCRLIEQGDSKASSADWKDRKPFEACGPLSEQMVSSSQHGSGSASKRVGKAFVGGSGENSATGTGQQLAKLVTMQGRH